jgi:hypothetical protein
MCRYTSAEKKKKTLLQGHGVMVLVQMGWESVILELPQAYAGGHLIMLQSKATHDCMNYSKSLTNVCMSKYSSILSFWTPVE